MIAALAVDSLRMETAPGMEILVLNVMEYVTLITRGVLIKHLLLLLGLIIIVEEAVSELLNCHRIYLNFYHSHHFDISLVHCVGYVYSEAVWSLYARELPNYYGYDDNTSLEIVTRLTYIAAGKTQFQLGRCNL